MAWVARCTSAIVLSPLTQYEFGNALRFAEFRRLLKPGAAAQSWALFEAALAQGRLIVETCNLADIVDEAKRLSATHTINGGHRGFDILHVAAALKLGATEFLTFDGKPKKTRRVRGASRAIVRGKAKGGFQNPNRAPGLPAPAEGLDQ